MKKLNVDGMTCINCQNKIEKKLRNLEGVQKVSVSYKTGIVEITYRSDVISMEEIKAAIERLDYHVVRESEKNNKHVTRTGITLLVIVFLYFLLQHFGVLNMLVPSQLADTKMGYGMLFIIGLITSVHCIAMCGGINLSQCIPRGTEAGRDNKKNSTFRPALLYNLGRVISYTVIGGILGFVGFLIGGGSDVGVPVMLQGILKLIAGIFMVIMGINMLGLFPWLRRFQPHIPYRFASKIHTSNKKNNGPLIVGLLNGLMPCGPLQAMQIVALASGNPFSGALSMFLFSLGTVPLMLGLGSIVSIFGKKFTRQVMNVGAILVVVLGLAMLSQGGLLSGLIAPNTLFLATVGLCVIGMLSILPYRKEIHKQVVLGVSVLLLIVSLALISMRISAPVSDSSTETSIQIVDGKQIIKSTLSASKYPEITVEAGIPVEWTIYAPEGSVNGCNGVFSIEEFGIIDYQLQEGNNVITFTPSTTGQFQYSCWMGMVSGTANVVEAKTKIDVISESQESSSDSVLQPYSGSSENITEDSASVNEDVQYITSTITDGGYDPITVQQGIPVKWTLKVPEGSLTGCNSSIVIPEYDLQVDLKEGDNLIEFTPTQSGTYSFSCWMGMIRSSITVLNTDGTSTDSAPANNESDQMLPGCCDVE